MSAGIDKRLEKLEAEVHARGGASGGAPTCPRCGQPCPRRPSAGAEPLKGLSSEEQALRRYRAVVAELEAGRDPGDVPCPGCGFAQPLVTRAQAEAMPTEELTALVLAGNVRFGDGALAVLGDEALVSLYRERLRAIERKGS